MASHCSEKTIPLPKGWTKRVKSALIPSWSKSRPSRTSVLFQNVANPEIEGVECSVETSSQVLFSRLRHASRGVRAVALEARQGYFRWLWGHRSEALLLRPQVRRERPNQAMRARLRALGSGQIPG